MFSRRRNVRVSQQGAQLSMRPQSCAPPCLCLSRLWCSDRGTRPLQLVCSADGRMFESLGRKHSWVYDPKAVLPPGSVGAGFLLIACPGKEHTTVVDSAFRRDSGMFESLNRRKHSWVYDPKAVLPPGSAGAGVANCLPRQRAYYHYR
jgi:hypothetical protein